MVLLPFKLRLFREPICKIVCFEQCVCLESGQRVSQDMILPKHFFATISVCQSMILPKYHFAKVLFCHNIILPKYHFAKISCCQNIVLPKYKFPKILRCSMIKLSFAKNPFAKICLQNDRPKSSQNNNLGRPQTPHFAQSPGVMVPLGPSSPVIATTSYPNIFQISILAWGDGSTGTIVLF